MDLATLAGTLARLGAPILGTALGGPAGAAVAGTIVDALAKGFGVEATPEAVGKALDKAEAPIVVQRVEASAAPMVMEAVNEYLRDVQDARATTVKLVEQGSVIAWGAPVVSVIVITGFALLSYLAIYASPGQREVLLFLLGAWSGLATNVVGYWMGSSAGSKDKDAQIAVLARQASR
jgi:hypothetical protein